MITIVKYDNLHFVTLKEIKSRYNAIADIFAVIDSCAVGNHIHVGNYLSVYKNGVNR